MILLLLSCTNYMQVSTWNIIRLRIISRLTVNDYCRIMFIRRGQRLWVANIFQVLGDVILLVMCVYMYIYVRGFKFVGKGYSRKPRTPPPPDQWRFLVLVYLKFLVNGYYILLTSVVLCVYFGTGARNFFVLFLNPNLPSFSVLKKKNK